jgi:hypothetical protein
VAMDIRTALGIGEGESAPAARSVQRG